MRGPGRSAKRPPPLRSTTRGAKDELRKDRLPEAPSGACTPEIRKSAQDGDSAAQYFLGLCYLDGNGVRKNSAFAVKWFREAADSGHPDAQYRLAECYMTGKGVGWNDDDALEWYRKAAAQGHREAKTALKKYLFEREAESRREHPVEGTNSEILTLGAGRREACSAPSVRLPDTSIPGRKRSCEQFLQPIPQVPGGERGETAKVEFVGSSRHAGGDSKPKSRGGRVFVLVCLLVIAWFGVRKFRSEADVEAARATPNHSGTSAGGQTTQSSATQAGQSRGLPNVDPQPTVKNSKKSSPYHVLALPNLGDASHEGLPKVQDWLADFEKEVGQSLKLAISRIEAGVVLDAELVALEMYLEHSQQGIASTNGIGKLLRALEQRMGDQIEAVEKKINGPGVDADLKKNYFSALEDGKRGLAAIRACMEQADCLGRRIKDVIEACRQWRMFYQTTAGVTGEAAARATVLKGMLEVCSAWVKSP